GEIGEGHRQRPRVAAHELVIGIGVAQAHFFSFGGNAPAKATLCRAQGSSARFVETDSASTRSQPFTSRPRISFEDFIAVPRDDAVVSRSATPKCRACGSVPWADLPPRRIRCYRSRPPCARGGRRRCA